MTEDSRFDGKDSEFDGKAWWETDGGSKYFDTQTFITHTRTIWDIWHKANLLHFFRVHLSSGGHQQKGSSILTWPGSGVTDGLMVSPEGLTAFATSRGLAYDPNDFCPHVGPAFFSINPIDNGTNQSLYMHHLWTFWGFFSPIEYWTEPCGHVPLLGTRPCPHVDIWIKQGSNITNVGHYLRSDQYQHVDNICKSKNKENI